MSFKIGPSSAGWGNRSQIGATIQDMKDAQGNKDGIWGNEDEFSHSTGSFFDRQPMISKAMSFASVGWSTKDEIQELSQFRAEKESEWGQSVSNLDLSSMKNGQLFAAQKAIALDRMDRKPSDVIDGFVQAAGKVDGEDIAPRKIFFQRFKPIGEPSGKVVTLSPGFQETGRNFYEQIQKLNELGHDVVVMDHQWAGQSEGSPGGLDRGFGASRDVAAVVAHANQIAEKEYGNHPDKEVVLFGNSMGAGPGVLGALVMNDNDLIELDGPQMPKGLRAVLQSPFLDATPNKINDALGLASNLPLLNKIQAPSAGVPVLTTDKVGAQKGAQSAVLEDVRAQLRSMSSANEDLGRIKSLIADGSGPKGQISIVHAERDPLADPGAVRTLASQLGDQATLNMVDSGNHVFEQNVGEQDLGINALQQLLSN